ncbi:MAG: ribosome maturation factor RimP [Lactobacillaceae bacterium]|nr:ribosome maturation factor RimP [Lactobacillaceae bacterium]
MANVVETVQAVLEPELTTKGFDLWNVAYEKLGSEMVLRVLVDRLDGAISMDDLVMLTELIGDVVDGITPDPFPEAYLMDVASPGAERELKRAKDFDWAVEKFIHVELTSEVNGQTVLDGELVAVDADTLTLAVMVKSKRQTVELARAAVKSAHLIIGMDRILTTDADFDWALNKLVRVTTYQKIDGKKEFEGELVGVTADELTVADDAEVEFTIPRAAIARASHANNF